jgi:hypothetical protein
MANDQRWRGESGFGGYEERDWRRGGGRAYEGMGYGGPDRTGDEWRGREAARYDQDRSFAPRDDAESRYGGGRYYGEGQYDRGYGRAYGDRAYRGGDDGYGAGYAGRGYVRYPQGGYGGTRAPYGEDRDAGFGDGGAYRTGYGGQDVESDRNWFGLGHGEHRGRGPKGYTRSDDRIREDVNDELSNDAWLDASEIEAMVKDGEVTLTGQVASREAKHRAEHCVEDIAGVKHVQNNLRVRERTATAGQTTGTTAPR